MPSLVELISSYEVWLGLGIIALIFEMIIPGIMLIWPGLAAVSVGAFSYFVDFDWQAHVLLWSVLMVAYAYLGRRFYGTEEIDEQETGLNQRAIALLGEYCTVEERTDIERGRVRVGDGSWMAQAIEPDMVFEKGAHVVVMDVVGTKLIVSPAPPH